ncbi:MULTISPECIES: DUF6957 family protein [Pseudomonas]|uniref:DUF6957 family protein n=2 Tax=Pseudomonas TaxID=286 RepID=UPI003857B97D
MPLLRDSEYRRYSDQSHLQLMQDKEAGLNRFRRHHFPVMLRSSLSLRIFPLLGESPFRLVVDTDERTAITDRGLIPALVYALTVIQDSKGRFAPGDWVRSTLEVCRCY